MVCVHRYTSETGNPNHPFQSRLPFPSTYLNSGRDTVRRFVNINRQPPDKNAPSAPMVLPHWRNPAPGRETARQHVTPRAETRAKSPAPARCDSHLFTLRALACLLRDLTPTFRLRSEGRTRCEDGDGDGMGGAVGRALRGELPWAEGGEGGRQRGADLMVGGMGGSRVSRRAAGLARPEERGGVSLQGQGAAAGDAGRPGSPGFRRVSGAAMVGSGAHSIVFERGISPSRCGIALFTGSPIEGPGFMVSSCVAVTSPRASVLPYRGDPTGRPW